jgi:hypothetical protein
VRSFLLNLNVKEENNPKPNSWFPLLNLLSIPFLMLVNDNSVHSLAQVKNLESGHCPPVSNSAVNLSGGAFSVPLRYVLIQVLLTRLLVTILAQTIIVSLCNYCNRFPNFFLPFALVSSFEV